MCKSQADGGQRCAAHTRPRYEAATFGTAEWDAAAAEHASTSSGEMDLAAAATEAELSGDTATAAAHWAALERGRIMRDMNAEVAEAVRVEALHADHAAKMRAWDAQSARIAEATGFADKPVDRWWERKMVVFDLETTGPDPHNDRMVTASIVEIYGDPNNPANIVAREWTVNPGTPISPGAQEVHGIDDETARAQGLNPSRVTRELATFLQREQANGVPIVGYNATYDMTMLSAEADRYGHTDVVPTPESLVMVDGIVIDRAANRYARGGRKLVTVAQRLGIGEFDAHNSTADCVASAKVVHHLVTSDPRLQVPAPTLHAWQHTWQQQYNTRMTAWIAKQGGDGRFDDTFGFLTQPRPEPEQRLPEPAAAS